MLFSVLAAAVQVVVNFISCLVVWGVVTYVCDSLLHLLLIGLLVVEDEDELLGLDIPLGRSHAWNSVGGLFDTGLAHATSAIDGECGFLCLGISAKGERKHGCADEKLLHNI